MFLLFRETMNNWLETHTDIYIKSKNSHLNFYIKIKILHVAYRYRLMLIFVLMDSNSFIFLFNVFLFSSRSNRSIGLLLYPFCFMTFLLVWIDNILILIFYSWQFTSKQFSGICGWLVLGWFVAIAKHLKLRFFVEK